MPPTEDGSELQLLRASERLGAGGYNRGAVFVMFRHGIVVNRNNKTDPENVTVPEGATFWRTQNNGLMQWAVHPGALEYKATRSSCQRARMYTSANHGHAHVLRPQPELSKS